MPSLPPQPIGQSKRFLELLDKVSDAAALEKPVLVVGERGTGKELIASRLHFLSPRWERVFISVNCAAFTDEGLDLELFGESFLDGREDTNGRFYHADSGTLFLDNIDMVSPRLQEKLMSAVEYGRFQASGESQTQEVDVRIICATGRDLPMMVQAGNFRADLLDRLAFHVLTLPPLRIRPTDIEPLAEHFGRKIAAEFGADSFPGFTAEAQQSLQTRPWPGNVRELKAVIERNVAKAFLADESLSEPLADLIFDPFDDPHRLRETPTRPLTQPQSPSPSLEAPVWVDQEAPAMLAPSHFTPPATEDAPTPTPSSPAPTQTFQDRVLNFERQMLQQAMRRFNDHQGKAADSLGLTYHSFRGLLRKHGLKK